MIDKRKTKIFWEEFSNAPHVEITLTRMYSLIEKHHAENIKLDLHVEGPALVILKPTPRD